MGVSFCAELDVIRAGSTMLVTVNKRLFVTCVSSRMMDVSWKFVVEEATLVGIEESTCSSNEGRDARIGLGDSEKLCDMFRICVGPDNLISATGCS